MSSKSNDQGRAFEYACIYELWDHIEDYRPCMIDSISVQAAKHAWNLQSSEMKEKLAIAA